MFNLSDVCGVYDICLSSVCHSNWNSISNIHHDHCYAENLGCVYRDFPPSDEQGTGLLNKAVL